MDVAFAEADLRRTKLMAVHAWQPSGPPADTGFVPPDPDELAAVREAARAELAEALAGHGATYPDVRVQREIVRGPVVDALVQASEEAEILVVGRHGRRHVGTFGLGSVARQCIKEAPCPVMITPVRRPEKPPLQWLTRSVPSAPVSDRRSPRPGWTVRRPGVAVPAHGSATPGSGVSDDPEGFADLVGDHEGA